MKINKTLIVLFMVPAIMAGACAKRDFVKVALNANTDYVDVRASELLDVIREFNSSSPRTISAGVFINADIKDQNYKATGRAAFDRERDMLNLTLHDNIFMTPIFKFFDEDNRLYFYYPPEKRLFIDHPGRVDISRYSEIELDYYIIKGIATGQMPLLNNYRVSKAVKEPGKEEYFLVVENDSYFQTVYIKDKMPEKMMLINRSTRQRHEIYLSNYKVSGDSGFYREIRIFSPGKRMDVKIVFNDVKLDTRVEIRGFKSETIPSDVKKTIHNR